MTRLPTSLHRSYARAGREFGPSSIPGLVEQWPISGGRQFTDSVGTTPAGAADPVGNWDGALGAADFIQATTAKKPTLDATGPGVRFDMVDDLLRATYALSMGSRWAICMAAWARDDSDKILLRAIGGGFLNLGAEFAPEGLAGANRQLIVPANFPPDNWLLADIFQADWANTDGIAHPQGALYADASNSIEWGKNSSGDLYVTVKANGTTKTATLTKAIAAGAWVFLGARLSGGTLTIYADTDSDGDVTDNTATATSVPASTGASWTYHHMANQALTAFGEGASNLVLTNDGSTAAPITDRFNAGAGMALAGDDKWLARYGESLVLHVGGNAAGTAIQADTYQGATDLLAGTATGRVDLSAGNYPTTADPGAGADSLTACSWGFTSEFDEVANNPGLLGRFDGADNQFLIRRMSSTAIRVIVANAGNDSSNYADFAVTMVAGTVYKFIITYSAGTLALYYKALNATTRQFGSQSTPSPSVTGTIPVTLRASALGYGVGGLMIGATQLDGKVDDIRIWYGKALTSAEADADLVNEPNPAGLSHWWPFDGDGVDAIGGLTATWTGTPAYVDDGRHHLGRFSRWLRQGQYYHDGMNDGISLGNYTGLDGATQASMWGCATIYALDAPLGGLWDTTGAYRQWCVGVGSNGKLQVFLSGDGTTYRLAEGNTVLSVGQRIVWWLRYKGGEATDADRVKIGVAVYDSATGTYPAPTAQTITFGGSAAAVPAALNTCGASAITYMGRLAVGSIFGSTYYRCALDEWRYHVSSALDVSVLNAQTVYSYDAGTWTDGYAFDGNANSRESVMPNGTVSGAIQWYDGRQPEGWTSTSLAEIDRATGANQSSEGTFGTRLKGDAAGDRLDLTTASLTAGRFAVLVGKSRETVAGATLTMAGSAFTVAKDGSVPTQATMADVGIAARADVSATASLRAIVGASAEAYFDNLRAFQLAVVSLSVSTSGVPSRVIWSASKNGALQPYVYAAIANDEKLEIGVRNDAGTRTEASSSGSVTTGVHSLIFEWDGTNLKAYLDTVLVATLTPGAGTYTGLDRLNLGGLVGYLEGHPFDERIGDVWLHAGASFPGYIAIDRVRLHNYLAARTTGLVAV